MLRKGISITLALLLAFSAAVVGINAADADTAETGGDLIYFDAKSAGWGWEDSIGILFYIYDLQTGTELAPWGSKQLRGNDDDGDGVWSFDPAKIGGLQAGRQYAVIFNEKQYDYDTYPLLLDTSCYGDTAYCTGSFVQNPADSRKSDIETRWKNNSLGPVLAITTTGKVVGETCPDNTTRYEMFEDFLTSDGSHSLKNVLRYSSDRTAQEVIDDLANDLGLSRREVQTAVSGSVWEDDWSWDRSTVPDSSHSPSILTLEGSITSYIDDSDVEIILEGSRIKTYHFGNSDHYEFKEIPADTYTLTVKKNNHVDREYTVDVTGDTTLDVQICPIGDANLDGVITNMDVTRANSHVQRKEKLTGYALLCADVAPYTDGITNFDVMRINSHVQKSSYLW